MQTVLLAFFALFASTLVLFFDGVMARGFWQQYESRLFLSAPGIVTHSEVKTHRGSKGELSYTPIIDYRFKIGTVNYTGRRIRYNSNFSDSTSASSLVAAYPLGAEAEIFYNPADPQDSLLLPGLAGADFILFLFLTPFNVVILACWMGMAGWLRQRLFRQVAGGVKIIVDGMSTRVRLPSIAPAAWGLTTTGGLAFVSVFVLGFSTRMQPSISLAVSTLALVYLAGAGVWLWHWRKLRTGIDDLVINKATGSIELPLTQGRKERVTAQVADIESLTVEDVLHVSRKGGRSHTFAPTLNLRGSQAGGQKLADWSDKVKANDFADWLRKELGL